MKVASGHPATTLVIRQIEVVDLGFVCGEASGGEMLATRLPTNCASQTIQLCRDRRKLFVARFAKGGNDFIIGCVFDRGGLKHSCFAAGRFEDATDDEIIAAFRK